MQFPAVSWRPVTRWAARISAALLLLMVATIVIGHAVAGELPNLLSVTPAEGWQFLNFGIIVAGLIVGFRWELAGGAAALVGLAAFHAVQIIATSRFAGGAFPWFLVPGLLYVASGLSSRKDRLAGVKAVRG